MLLVTSAPGREWLLLAHHAYEYAALARPIITKSATSAVAYALGDALAQRLVPAAGRRGPLDRGRILRSTLAGGISHGPQLHFWSLFLEHFLGPGQVVRKILLDQTLFGLYINGAYTVLTELLKGTPPAAVWRRVRDTSWPSLRASWKFWPAVHALTYSVVPVHMRVLWIDAVEVVWVGILSTCVAAPDSPQQPVASGDPPVPAVAPRAASPPQLPLDKVLPAGMDLYEMIGQNESAACGIDLGVAVTPVQPLQGLST